MAEQLKERELEPEVEMNRFWVPVRKDMAGDGYSEVTGKIMLSIQLVPIEGEGKDAAPSYCGKALPAGEGRESPNENPRLPLSGQKGEVLVAALVGHVSAVR